MEIEIILWIVAVVFSLVGLAGSVIPALPGVTLNFLAIVILYFLKDDFVSIYTIAFFSLLTILAFAVDFVLPAIKARKFGASKYGLWGLVIGMVLGFFTLAFIGMIVGALVGAATGELMGGKKMREAARSSLAAFGGTIMAMIVKLGISLTMAIYFFFKLASLLF